MSARIGMSARVHGMRAWVHRMGAWVHGMRALAGRYAAMGMMSA